MPGDTIKGPKDEAGNFLFPVANNTSNEGYVFDGWYEANGNPVNSGDSITESKEAFARFSNNTFLAPANQSISNPRNITGAKYSVSQVKAAATEIASKGSSSSYYWQYRSWMNADSYHLYTLLNGNSASSADSWVEFRIVHVGQHDSDGSGLTFQAVHMLPTAYQMNSTNTSSGGWASSALRAKMQSSGEIYNMFDTQLTNRVYNITRNSKGKFWLPSYSELTGATHPRIESDGSSQFAYWEGKVTKATDANSCLVIAGTRSKRSLSSDRYFGWWLRSPDTAYPGNFDYVGMNGNPYYGTGYANLIGVVPCFAL